MSAIIKAIHGALLAVGFVALGPSLQAGETQPLKESKVYLLKSGSETVAELRVRAGAKCKVSRNDDSNPSRTDPTTHALPPTVKAVLEINTGPNVVVVTADDIQSPPEGGVPSASFVDAFYIPLYTHEVVNTYPHDPDAFTQGLLFLDDAVFESTGLEGQSSLRKVEWETGRVLKRVEVPEEYFAEGLAALNGKLFQLTWKSHKVFVYDLESFRMEKEFNYGGEGWGLTTDGQSLILSDGTDRIRFLDPDSFQVTRTIRVLVNGRPADRLNELEYIKGQIYANVYGADYVLRICPATGRVTGVVDFAGLLTPDHHAVNADVLNGIAYDAATDRIFVTGKRWPKLFEVRLRRK